MKTAVFWLLVVFCFLSLDAAAQTRCEVAAGSIVSAEGEIQSSVRRVVLVQSVAARTETRLCPGEELSWWAREAERPFASEKPDR